MVESTCAAPTQYYESAIESFRPCFSRQASFCWFAVVMVGFMVRQDAWGLSSIVRWLALSPSCYECLLNFFHSSAWNLESLVLHWWVWLGAQAPVVEVNGRRVLLGDHTKLAKEGRKMPGVTTLHQDSETQSKPGFFRGHNWAFVAGLLSRAGAVFAIPLYGKLDQGLDESGQPTEEESSMTTRIVHMAITMAARMDWPCYLVLDAFFAVGPTFLAAASRWCEARREPLVHIITRAKKNAVAYLDPQKPPPGRRGRKPKYGPKLRLYDLFAQRAGDFTSAPCEVYARLETVSYLSLNLLWKPLGHKLRFVLAVTSRGPVVLMCSDLTLNPLEIIRLYCLRTRIETMFFVLKHIMGGLAYHFWCKCLHKQSRRAKKNSESRVRTPEQARQAGRTWKAIEGFVNMAAMSQGLLQLIALNRHQALWHANHLWLRTYSASVPSEAVTRNILARSFAAQLCKVAPSAIMQIVGINNKQVEGSCTPDVVCRGEPMSPCGVKLDSC